MDPLSAVSLAGTVVSFVDFASTLVHKSLEIYDSASGTSVEETSLEFVYQRLQECSTELSAGASNVDTQSGAFSPNYSAVRALAQDCQQECNTILKVIEKLKDARKIEDDDGPGKRRWKSFIGASKAVFNDRDLKGIEKRLQRTQITLTVHLCAILSRFHQEQVNIYEKFKQRSERYQTSHELQLEKIRSILESLNDRRVAAEDKHSQTLYQRDDVRSLERQMSLLRITTKDIDFQQTLISSFNFSRCRARHDSIPRAHQQTLNWALHGNGEEQTQRLLQWLLTGSGIFWVSGKPGSGKSTFMKYLADNKETSCRLVSWANPRKPVIASHYFWYGGTAMQKSQQGLLQTLLFDIFRQCPELTSIARDCLRSSLDPIDNVQNYDWNIDKLRTILKRLAVETDLPVKFCFFIDGLDEYYGDHLELSQDLLTISRSPSIKLCVASRPWNVFEDTFGQVIPTKLYMHELNKEDIRKYSTCRLSEHPRWDILLKQVGDARSLIDDITERSMGVFLWVFLVTRLLREGLTNDDSLSDLQERLQGLPSDLGDFFQNILGSVDPFYHKKMAAALQMTLVAHEPLDILLYHFHDFQFDDNDHATRLRTELSCRGAVDELRILTARRINGYCRGLIETHRDSVEFLHRTVKDFLKTREMSEFLEEKTSPGFDPTLTILSGFSTMFEVIKPAYIGPKGRPWMLKYTNLTTAMRYALILQEQEDESLAAASVTILGKMENALQHNWDMQDFIHTATQQHLADFLEKRLQEEPDCLDSLAKPAITLLVESDCSELTALLNGPRTEFPTTLMRTLKVLLDNGQDPNQTRGFSNISPWLSFFQGMFEPKFADKVVRATLRKDRFVSALRAGVLDLFLRYGADANAGMHIVGGRPKTTSCSTLCGDFIMASLEMQLTGSDCAAYLRTLEVLLAKDVALFQITGKELLGTATLDNYPNHFLAQLANLGTIGNPTKRAFLAEVMTSILVRGKELGWPMIGIWHFLEPIFGSKHIARMQARWGQAGEPLGEIGQDHIKRSRSDSLEAESGKRRALGGPLSGKLVAPSGEKSVAREVVYLDSDEDQDEGPAKPSRRAGTARNPYVINDDDDDD